MKRNFDDAPNWHADGMLRAALTQIKRLKYFIEERGMSRDYALWCASQQKNEWTQ